MPKDPVRGNTPALPAVLLDEIHDCLTLALDATERRGGYAQAEREARSYVRAALRTTNRIIGWNAQ